MPGKHSKNQADPYVYASLLSAYMTDRNPIEVLVGDVSRMLGVITGLGKTRQLAQMRIDQLQQQVQRVEQCIDTLNPKTAGTRFDRLR